MLYYENWFKTFAFTEPLEHHRPDPQIMERVLWRLCGRNLHRLCNVSIKDFALMICRRKNAQRCGTWGVRSANCALVTRLQFAQCIVRYYNLHSSITRSRISDRIFYFCCCQNNTHWFSPQLMPELVWYFCIFYLCIYLLVYVLLWQYECPPWGWIKSTNKLTKGTGTQVSPNIPTAPSTVHTPDQGLCRPLKVQV